MSTSPSASYDGPEFDEYCIDQGSYLPARRDRTPCTCCPLGELCQAGFEEQVRRAQAGENSSLTEGVFFDVESLKPAHLLQGLTEDQKVFVLDRVFVGEEKSCD
jgi:hypothetical protein